MNAHDEAVELIAIKTREYFERKQPYRIYHGSTNSTRHSQLRRDQCIDTSKLKRVLSVNTETKTALVEPNVPMDSLVESTLQHGLIPPVVMEFPGITVGGGFSGTSGESSSFRYGFFDRTVNWVEMVLANGKKVIASRTQLPDLFYGAASSFGTLGIVTLVELQLVESKPFVELAYHPVNSVPEALQKIDEATKDTTIDYLDGILFSKDHGVICTGRLSDHSTSSRIQRFTRATDPWFYIHCQGLYNKSSAPVTEAIPIVDYLFRYDRGAFWTGAYAYRYFLTPFNRLTRWALDYFMHTRVMYHALHRSGLADEFIIQDVAIPYPSAEEFVNYLDRAFTHYPLWLCPLKQTGKSSNSTYGLTAEKPAPNAPEMLLNFGVWGPGPRGRRAFIEANRSLEQKVDSLGGKKWLYAQTYYTEEEFWNIYDRKEYDALRQKYHATHLPSLYDKVKVDFAAEERSMNASWKIWLLAFFWSIWPLSGLYGVLSALLGGNYLMPASALLKVQNKHQAKR
jgi:delta24-sterol reductase